MKGFDFSKFRTRAVIEEVVETEDEGGGRSRVWRPFCTVWGELIELKGGKRMIGMQIADPTTHKFLMRYWPGVVPKMRATINGKIFMLQHISDEENRHRFLTLRLEAGVAT